MRRPTLGGFTLGAAMLVMVGGSRGAPFVDRGAPPESKILGSRHVAVTAAPARDQGRVVELSFWAQSRGVRKRLLAWLPPSYDRSTTRRYPVAFYLHGLWGDETNWTRLGALANTLDSLVGSGMPEFIVVMPDGDDGWYTTWNTLGDYGACRREFKEKEGDTVDSYCVPWLHYDDYVARDVVAIVDRELRTDPRRARRAIAGLSMGGYGALSIAFQYPDVFSVAVSHSGVLSPLHDGPTPFAAPARYAASAERLKERWGERFWPLIGPAFGPDTTAWWARDPARTAARLWRGQRSKMPAVMFDVGTEDDLLDQNRAFRWELQRLGVPHQYTEWPGKHDWPYWTLHARESLRFIAARIAN